MRIGQRVLAWGLRKVDWNDTSPIHPELFDALCGAFKTSGVECGVFRTRNGVLEIFMCQRRADDMFYPGEWHIPGTLFYGSRETEDVAFARLVRKEIGDFQLGPRQFICSNHFPHNPRGGEVTLLFVREWLDDRNPTMGTFFPIDALPPHVVEHHLMLVDQIKQFLRQKNP